MNIIKSYISIFTLFFVSLHSTAQNLEGQIKKYTDSVYAANPKAVGFALYVEAPDQQLSFSYAVGYSNRETKQKLTAEQPVLIASTTKPYVAAAILRLVEDGKMDIHQSIKKYLSPKSEKILSDAGYKTAEITIKQLLSHTSGIRDYVDEGYFKFIGQYPKHAWTRDQQIARAAELGKPLSEPGEGFRYADINYILITEVIERVTHQPYYKAISKLLEYKKHKLMLTRFAKLEQVPKSAAQQAHQYWDQFAWDTYNLDPSWDLYGGGGIVTNVKEMALFFQLLFNGNIIKDKKVLEQLTTDVPPNLEINYCLGIRKIKYAGLLGYNHGGGLGTDAIYIPELNASISIVSLEASHRPIAVKISKEIVKLLKK